MAQGATQEQLQAWYKQNATQLATQRQQAQAMAMASGLQPVPAGSAPVIPTDTPALQKTFLTTQIALARAHAKLHNLLIRQAGTNLTATQVSALEKQEATLFVEQNASMIAEQKQRIEAMALTSAQTLQKVPGPVVIPPDATPQMAAFLTTRHQLRVEEVQLSNEYINAAPAVRAAAMSQWRQQNAAPIAQLRQEAQALSPVTPNSTN